MNRGQIIERLSNQSSIDQKRQKAHVVIENNQDLFFTWQSVLNEWEKLRKTNETASGLFNNSSILINPFKDTLILPQSEAFSTIEKYNTSTEFFTWLSENDSQKHSLKTLDQQDLVRLFLTHFVISSRSAQEIGTITIWDLSQFDLTLNGYRLSDSSNTKIDLQTVLEYVEKFGQIHLIQRINIPLDIVLKERMTSFRERGYNLVNTGDMRDPQSNKAGYNLYQKNISEGFNLFSV